MNELRFGIVTADRDTRVHVDPEADTEWIPRVGSGAHGTGRHRAVHDDLLGWSRRLPHRLRYGLAAACCGLLVLVAFGVLGGADERRSGPSTADVEQRPSAPGPEETATPQGEPRGTASADPSTAGSLNPARVLRGRKARTAGRGAPTASSAEPTGAVEGPGFPGRGKRKGWH
jgi:hypothetical protein